MGGTDCTSSSTSVIFSWFYGYPLPNRDCSMDTLYQTHARLWWGHALIQTSKNNWMQSLDWPHLPRHHSWTELVDVHYHYRFQPLNWYKKWFSKFRKKKETTIQLNPPKPTVTHNGQSHEWLEVVVGVVANWENQSIWACDCRSQANALCLCKLQGWLWIKAQRRFSCSWSEEGQDILQSYPLPTLRHNAII